MLSPKNEVQYSRAAEYTITGSVKYVQPVGTHNANGLSIGLSILVIHLDRWPTTL